MGTTPNAVQACQSGGPKVTLKDNSAFNSVTSRVDSVTVCVADPARQIAISRSSDANFLALVQGDRGKRQIFRPVSCQSAIRSFPRANVATRQAIASAQQSHANLKPPDCQTSAHLILRLHCFREV